MFLGISLIIIGFVMGIIMLRKGHDSLYFAFTMGCSIIGALFMFYTFNPPLDARYSVNIGAERRFSNYSYVNGDIVIPSHYISDQSWINTWKYCDSQITIVVPENQTVEIREINNMAKMPYIVGECK